MWSSFFFKSSLNYKSLFWICCQVLYLSVPVSKFFQSWTIDVWKNALKFTCICGKKKGENEVNTERDWMHGLKIMPEKFWFSWTNQCLVNIIALQRISQRWVCSQLARSTAGRNWIKQISFRLLQVLMVDCTRQILFWLMKISTL